MGWLIRYIHNRDLAAENIMTAYVRQRFVMAAPAEALDSLHAKLEKAGLSLPVRSLLNNVKQIFKKKQCLAGAYKVELNRNARKERVVDLTSSSYAPSMAATTREVTTTYKLGPPRLTTVVALSDNIRINGRPYRQGDYCEFALHVGRTRPHLANTPESRGLGVVQAFYLVPCGRNKIDHLFVAVLPVPADMQPDGYHQLSVHADSHGEHTSARMLHVDSITYKLRKVPEPKVPGPRGEAKDDGERFLFIRVWESR